MAKDPNPKSFSLKSILQKHEDQLLNVEASICLLCKRKFKDTDQMQRHRSLSKLHSSRLKRLKQCIFTDEQLERLERKEREALYRDRAKERREMFGQADAIVTEQAYSHPSDRGGSFSNKKRSHYVHTTPAAPAKPLGLDNKGAALLSKMGWKEGSGLGKTSEGITDIIKLDAHVGTSGLGSKTYKAEPHLSYKEAVKKIMFQRYQELSSDEDN